MWKQKIVDKAYTSNLTYLSSGYGKEWIFELELGSTKPLEDWDKSVNLLNGTCSIKGLDGKKYKLKCDLEITLLNYKEKINFEENKEVAL